MDSHSKREVLEIFNINKKNVMAGFLFLNPPPICQLFVILSRMVLEIVKDRVLYFYLCQILYSAPQSVPNL